MKPLLFAAALMLPAKATHLSDTWEWTLESGYLWKVRDNSPLDYEIVPTQLVLRSPVIMTFWEDESGAKIVVRNRFALLAEAITRGPEDYYLGVSAAPSLEYWFPSQTTSLFFSVGGGLGWLNSAGGNTGGQGQDLAFNWFGQLGVRQQIGERLSLLAGAYFTHHSNLGMTDPNPGIDALGFTVGCSWHF